MERVVKECKGKLLDSTKEGYQLYDFNVKYSLDSKFKGRGVHNIIDDDDKAIRVLKVVCPSTKQNYFLRIPVDDKFNTCYKARQGTFNGFDPEAKEVMFALET